MSHDIRPYLVHETLFEDHRTDGLRSGEGCVTTLGDGSLLMIYGKFQGPGDHDHANLMATRSSDGVAWTTPEVFQTPPDGALNVMSVSLLPLQDGRLAALYLLKVATTDCRPVFMTSDDDGRTWSDPVMAIGEKDYYVVNNDRLVQLGSGRIVVPFCRYDVATHRGRCGCAWSDDGGRTWAMGEAIEIQKEHVRAPRVMDPNHAEAQRIIAEGDVRAQEPGFIELLDGRVMMWVRTTGGYAYRAYSSDQGQTWSPFQAIGEFAMPCGPQSIKRLPRSKRMIMLYNDRGDIPFGHAQFQWRRTMNVATSDDDGATWQSHGLLESPDLPTHCYHSICFHGENVITTSYEGVMRGRDGYFTPRNLASLKLKVIRRAFFEL